VTGVELQEQATALHTESDQHRNHRLELSEEISQGLGLNWKLGSGLRRVSRVSPITYGAGAPGSIDCAYGLFQTEPDTPITLNDEVTKMLEKLVTITRCSNATERNSSDFVGIPGRLRALAGRIR